jgi:hypothetical protein
MFAAAEHCIAYDGCIAYDVADGVAIVATTALRVELYFKSEERAEMMRTAIWTNLRAYTPTFDERSVPISVSPSKRPCENRVSFVDMRNGDTPDRQRWAAGETIDDPVSVPSSEYHRLLSDETIKRETIVDVVITFDRAGYRPQWAHIKPQKRCRSGVEVRDSANRIVLPVSLHTIYDSNTSLGGRPRMDIYYDEKECGPVIDSDGGYKKLFLVVLFASPEAANALQPREGTARTSATKFLVPIEKLATDVDRFIGYINDRHNEYIRATESNAFAEDNEGER